MDESHPIPEYDLTKFCKLELNKIDQLGLHSEREWSAPNGFVDEDKFHMQITVKQELFEEVEERSETENEIPQIKEAYSFEEIEERSEIEDIIPEITIKQEIFEELEERNDTENEISQITIKQEIFEELEEKNDTENEISQIIVKKESFEVEEMSEVENEIPQITVKQELFEELEEMSETDDEMLQNELQSEYEKMVQKNRKKQEAIRKLKRPPSDALSAPLRKSRRLAKMDDIDLSEAALFQKAIVEAKKSIVPQPKKIKNADECEFQWWKKRRRREGRKRRERRKRREERQREEELPAVLPFEEAFRDKSQIDQLSKLYKPFIQDFFRLHEKKAEPYNKYVSHLKQMQLHESQNAKVVPDRITALTVHPIYDKTIIVAGDKFGNLGFRNMHSDNNLYMFKPHLAGVTTLKINPFHSNQVVSSSYDGTLRCGDIDRHVFDEIYNLSSDCCTYFDVLSPTTFIVAHHSGQVAFADYRSSSKVAGNRHRCHDYPVKSVSVHPVNKNYFLTSELKGSICLWDLRKLQELPVLKVYQHDRTASSAFFSPVTGKKILSTSADNSLCIFDSSNLHSGKTPLRKLIEHNNATGRWLSLFRAAWLPNVEDTFVVGSMLYPKRVEIYNTHGINIHNFMLNDLDITSLHAFHPYRPLMAGGNSRGEVVIFADSA